MNKESLVLLFNIIAISIFLLNIFIGYKKGFVGTVLKLISGIVSLFVAYTFGPVLAKGIDLTVYMPDVYKIIGPFINRVLWYAITFVVCLILMKILIAVTSVINKIPLVGFVNKLGGAAISLLYSLLICGVLSLILSLPVFDFKEAYDNSVFKPINVVTVEILKNVAAEGAVFDANAENAKEAFYNWLIDNDLINFGSNDKNNFDLFKFLETNNE